MSKVCKSKPSIGRPIVLPKFHQEFTSHRTRSVIFGRFVLDAKESATCFSMNRETDCSRKEMMTCQICCLRESNFFRTCLRGMKSISTKHLGHGIWQNSWSTLQHGVFSHGIACGHQSKWADPSRLASEVVRIAFSEYAGHTEQLDLQYSWTWIGRRTNYFARRRNISGECLTDGITLYSRAEWEHSRFERACLLRLSLLHKPKCVGSNQCCKQIGNIM